MISFLMIVTALVNSSSASAAGGGPFLSYVELEAMAKAAVQEEVVVLNEVIADYMDVTPAVVEDWHRYREHNLKTFRKFNKRKGVATNVIYDACLLTQNTIGAITSE